MGGNFTAIGMVPLEGTLFPKGMHNAVPNWLRPYIYYFPKTNIPIPFPTIEWGNFTVYPLGMKALPNRFFTSKNRQMYRAIIDSDFQHIEKLIDDGFDPTKEIVIYDNEYTALGMAVSLNLIEVVDYLAKRGVDFEHCIGPYKKTALHIAVENGNELIVKYLLNNGANLDAKDFFGLNIYEKAEFRGYYHFKNIFDYFKHNPKQKKIIDYEEYRYTRDIILEDIDTINFKPSNLLEISVNNKIIPDSENEKFNLDKFELYMTNQFDIDHIEESLRSNLRKRYDDLYYFNKKLYN